MSEQPPGNAPTRYRFLQRGRIIAVLAGVTCVVEARWRSGALHTAHQAETIARHVAAVPGSVHSANSAGCHRLLRDGGAILVTDAAEISELLAAVTLKRLRVFAGAAYEGSEASGPVVGCSKAAKKEVWTMCTPSTPDCAVQPPDCPGFRMFPRLPSNGKGGNPVRVPPRARHTPSSEGVLL
ncbi:DNA-processing protein DprA [Paenarthrobacter sp. CAP02]|uniref:DNA-processing protein DprA n=1 Tax=Paenarthrobacter sp. CAP02 TaxID=3158144 RepID=UPI0032DBE4BF